MREDEFDFANDAHGAIEQSSSFASWAIVLSVFALLISAALWASIAEVEQITAGDGKVIPSSKIQVVESLNAGIVAEILVSEGENVDISQPLIRLVDTGYAARLGELRQKQISLKFELSRLRAEARNAKEFPNPDGAAEASNNAYVNQLAIFRVNQKRLEQQTSVRNFQLEQKVQSLAETQANVDKHANSLKLMKRELKLSERLFKKRAITELEILRLRRTVLELSSDMNILKASKAGLVAEVAEMNVLIESDITAFISEVQVRISKVNTELSVVDESILAARDQVTRAILRSPVKGVVNNLNVAAIGEVVSAGVSVAEIVPLGDKLLIEARIRPQDIGFIRPGLPAVIRLSAYDYTKYGTLSGEVERIGASTITDENNETFYQIIVSTEINDSNIYGTQLKVIPGMIASVDVSTGKRTILEYLMKPVLKISNRAFRDPA